MRQEPVKIGADIQREPSVAPVTGPLLVWLAVQLVALALAAAGIPLAAKWPRPAEGLAPHVMLAAQISAAALLFPYLLRDWHTTAVTVASAWPLLLIAAVLASAPLDRAALAGIYVTAWLIALMVWRAGLPETAGRSIGVSVAAIVAIGSAALWYLQSEYGSDGSPGPPAALGPVTSSLGLLAAPREDWLLWLAPAGIAACGGALLLVRHVGRARRRNSIPTSDASAPY